MSEHRRMMALLRLRARGAVEMSPTGEWKLTRKGEDELDEIELMMELKRRPAPEATPRGMMNGRSRAGRRPRERS